MRKSVIRRYQLLCLLSGVIMGCIFPVFSSIFMEPKTKKAEMIFSVACIVAGIAVGIMSYTIGKMTVIKTIMKLEKSFNKMSDGDFTEICTIQSKDAIGELVKHLEDMRGSLGQLIGTVRNETIVIEDNVSFNKEQVHQLSNAVTELKLLAERVLEDMNFVSDNSATLSHTATEIDAAIKGIADKASDGVGVSVDIAEKAANAKQELGVSIDKANVLLKEASDKMETALHNIEVVEQIRILLDTIMRVSAKTNLLALNASIEANRAGSDGAGFSVIATEIRDLSEESKHNTEQISKVVNEVVGAVNELASCSRELLLFLSENVKKDYEGFQNIVEEYDNNSKYMEELVTDLSSTSEELFASLQVVTDRINDISGLATNSTEKVKDIFEEINDINSGAKGLVDSTQLLEDNAGELKVLVKAFKLE